MKLPFKNILITGGAGFVGSSLALKLKKGYPRLKITVLDSLKRRGSELILSEIKRHGIIFRHGDIRNKEDLEDLSCDLLIECSAEAACVAGLKKDLSYLVNTNFIGALNCLDLAARHQAAFLFLSSSRVYPFDRINSLDFREALTRLELASSQSCCGVSVKGISEDFPLEGTRTFYGATKLGVEYFVREYAHFRKVKTIVNRCGVITGPWQMGKVDQGIIVFWIAAHIFGRPLQYIGWGGKQVRDFLHIDDLFKIIQLQLAHLDEHQGKVVNVGGGPNYSFSLLELTKICQKVTGKKVPVGYQKTVRPGDVCWYISDISRVCSLFEWKPSRKLDKTVEEIFRWIKDNKVGLKSIL